VVRTTRDTLVDWLERHAFKPVLRADPQQYPRDKRIKLKGAQDRARTEFERFRSCRSATDVVTRFKRDLRSPLARELHRDLADLGLPTPRTLRHEFDDLVYRLASRG
jgi:hypothetical protein